MDQSKARTLQAAEAEQLRQGLGTQVGCEGGAWMIREAELKVPAPREGKRQVKKKGPWARGEATVLRGRVENEILEFYFFFPECIIHVRKSLI